MAKRRKWLRWMLRAGGILAATLVLMSCGVLLLMMRKPLDGAILEEPAPRFSGEVAQSKRNSIGVKRSKFPIDPERPPKSFDEYARLSAASQSDEGSRSYVELQDYLRDSKFNDDFCYLSMDYPEAAEPYYSDCAEWISQQREAMRLLRRMIDCGGPPFPSDEDMVALGRTEFPNDWRGYLFFNIMATFLRAEMRMSFERGHHDAATESSVYLIKYMALMQQGPRPLCGEAWHRGMEGLSANFGRWLELNPPNPTQAVLIAAAFDELEPYGFTLARSEQTRYRVRRRNYLAAINGSPSVSFRSTMFLSGTDDFILTQIDDEMGLEKSPWYAPTALRVLNVLEALRLKATGRRTIEELDKYWNHRMSAIEEGLKSISESNRQTQEIDPGADRLLQLQSVHGGLIGGPLIPDIRREQAKLDLLKAAMVELAGSQLGAEPILDNYSGKPFLRRREGDLVIIWSVGRNGIDDGGPTASWNGGRFSPSNFGQKHTDDLGISVLVPISQR